MEDNYQQSIHFQEPHCLNTSILDCSVTFTVDKDMCIHGIEVPSQVRLLNRVCQKVNFYFAKW